MATTPKPGPGEHAGNTLARLPFLQRCENNSRMKQRMTQQMILSLCTLAATSVFAADGYKDTPLIPGTQWHVHDPDRPKPRIITSGITFSDVAAPPSDAIVLFD